MVLHEEEAQGEHGLCLQEAGGGHQEHVDERHGPQVLPDSSQTRFPRGFSGLLRTMEKLQSIRL
jgi:hypothetical protein